VPRAQYARSPDREIQVARTSPGRYSVNLSPSVVTTGATIQVTPYGAVPRRCGVLSWGGGRANVQCVNMSGQPADTPFTLLAVKGRWL
jgi:hypothetical protein